MCVLKPYCDCYFRSDSYLYLSILVLKAWSSSAANWSCETRIWGLLWCPSTMVTWCWWCCCEVEVEVTLTSESLITFCGLLLLLLLSLSRTSWTAAAAVAWPPAATARSLASLSMMNSSMNFTWRWWVCPPPPLWWACPWISVVEEVEDEEEEEPVGVLACEEHRLLPSAWSGGTWLSWHELLPLLITLPLFRLLLKLLFTMLLLRWLLWWLIRLEQKQKRSL